MTERAEKQFYLRELAGRTVLLALAGDPAPAREVLDELQRNDTRLVVVVDAEHADELEPRITCLGTVGADEVGRDLLGALWARLRSDRVVVVATKGSGPESLNAVAERLGALVRPTKAVLAAPGLSDERLGSFLDLDADPEPTVGPSGAVALRVAASLLDAGVHTVNLCDPERIADELFTYDGAGTLVSHGSYLSVERLHVDQYDEVEALLDGGVRDGYLRPRGPDELARVLFDGFGACLSTSGHLAGVVALETESYAPEPVGELVSLITINRFSGQGVATALVEHAVGVAIDAGLDSLFACTTSSSATAFFEANGFERVEQSTIPAAKWEGYEQDRRDRVQVVRRTLRSGSELRPHRRSGLEGDVGE